MQLGDAESVVDATGAPRNVFDERLEIAPVAKGGRPLMFFLRAGRLQEPNLRPQLRRHARIDGLQFLDRLGAAVESAQDVGMRVASFAEGLEIAVVDMLAILHARGEGGFEVRLDHLEMGVDQVGVAEGRMIGAEIEPLLDPRESLGRMLAAAIVRHAESIVEGRQVCVRGAERERLGEAFLGAGPKRRIVEIEFAAQEVVGSGEERVLPLEARVLLGLGVELVEERLRLGEPGLVAQQFAEECGESNRNSREGSFCAGLRWRR